MRKRLLKIGLIIGSFLSIAYVSHAQSQGQNLELLAVAHCAQEITDFGHGSDQGIFFSADLLKRMLGDRQDLQNLNKECDEFKKSHKQVKPNRERQLEVLKEIQNRTPENIYFFLRGAIRPLIACKRVKNTNLVHYRICQSATGKSWYELSLNEARPNVNVIYRLGHSPLLSGIIVRGPQDYFSDDDAKYMHSLPTDFVGSAFEDLPKELNWKFLNMKVFMLSWSSQFIEHYF